jgi:hypothetical protein
MIADHKCKNYMLELQAAIVSDPLGPSGSCTVLQRVGVRCNELDTCCAVPGMRTSAVGAADVAELRRVVGVRLLRRRLQLGLDVPLVHSAPPRQRNHRSGAAPVHLALRTVAAASAPMRKASL